MKTALQELKETIQEMINHGGDEDLLSVIAHIENTFIEKEKEQIVQAINETQNVLIVNDIIVSTFMESGTLGEKYYNQKYNENKQ